MTGAPGVDTRDERRLTAVVLGIGVVLHLALLAYFAPIRLWFSGAPIHTFDYALHVYQVDRAVTAFRETGHLWSYDPFVLAGQPAGVVEDLTSKSVELFVIGASALGMKRWVAFNFYVLLIHLGMPLAGWVSARAFGLSRYAAALTVMFWVVLWYFDSLLHWCWFVGMISWSAASYSIVLAVALLYRAGRSHRTGTYVALGAVAAAGTLIHPFSVLALLCPLAALYARDFRRFSVREHGMLVAGVIAAGLTTLVWIRPALRFRHDIGTVDAFLWPTLPYAFFDWLDLLKDVLMTGQPVRAGFRMIVLVLAAIGLIAGRKRGDDRVLPWGVLIFGSVVLCYASSYSAALRQTQPYRYLCPATLGAALVTASLVAEHVSLRGFLALGRDAKTALVLGAIAGVPHLGRTVLGYLPTLLPSRPSARTAFRPGPIPGVSNEELPLVVMGHDGPLPGARAIGDALMSSSIHGRVAVLDWVLGEYLSVFTPLPILGGIPQRNVPQVAAHPLRHDLVPKRAGDDPFARYLDEYAVGAFVTSGPAGPFDERRDLLALKGVYGNHRLYLVRKPPSYFAAGSGTITQALNLLTVDNAAGHDIVLRFHFLESLRCRPDCDVERAPADDDPAGFIRVRHPPRTFEIYNAY